MQKAPHIFELMELQDADLSLRIHVYGCVPDKKEFFISIKQSSPDSFVVDLDINTKRSI